MDRVLVPKSRFLRPFSLLLRSFSANNNVSSAGRSRNFPASLNSTFRGVRNLAFSPFFSFCWKSRLNVLVSYRSKFMIIPSVIINRNFVMSPINSTLVESNQAEGVVDAKKQKINDGKENETLDRTKLYFVKLSSTAQIPSKGSKLAAGYDLKSAYKVTVPKRGSALVKTDIQIQLPSGTYGRVAPRSGLALKNKIDVGAGVIDEDYRGNVGVILFNHGDVDFEVEVGDRIAQLICEKIEYPEAVEVESLEESERGAGGFGSTGMKN